MFALDRRAIVSAVEMLLEHDRLTIEDADVVRDAVARLRRASKVGFSDCLMLEVARRAGHLPLGTFDRAVGRLADADLL